MFTGIVEELGEVAAIQRRPGSAVLALHGPLVSEDLKPGDSIAVNGVCLTVTAVDGPEFSADVMSETLDRSTLGSLAPGDPVNLERAATPATRLGGHLVQGHVDAVGTVLARRSGDHSDDVSLAMPAALARYVVEKGSIAVDGVSLTVARIDGDSFTVSLIPTTLRLTTLGRRQVGDTVNLEVDVIGKYVERLLERT